MKKKIKSICVGNDAGSIVFSTDEKLRGRDWFVDEIKKETKVIGEGYYNDLTLIVYRGYIHGDKEPVFEIESNNGLVIQFYPNN